MGVYFADTGSETGSGARPVCEKRSGLGVGLARRYPCTLVAINWVPEGNLAGFWGGALLKSGRPRGPGKAFKNVEGFAPHIFEGFPGSPGPARPQKRTPTNPARLHSGTQP